MKTRLFRTAALSLAAALVLLPSAADAANPVVAQATATALVIEIAGSGGSSGTVSVTNDGKTETKTGDATPAIGVLKNQDLVDAGVLVQDAATSIVGKDGHSQACSGVAGNGGTVIVNVGESGCITPGDPVGISIANLNLIDALLIDPESAIGGLAPLNALSALYGPLTAAISDGLAPLGAVGLGGTLGAVEAICSAEPGTATGTANIVDTKLTLEIGGQVVDLVKLPVHAPPNTKVLTDLDIVLDAVIDGLRVDINDTLDGALAPLQAIIDPIQDQLVDVLVAQIADQLGPLEENILDITLNKQTSSEKGQISVTAIDLQLLPAAGAFTGGFSFVGAEIANVTCGPNGRVGPNPPPVCADPPCGPPPCANPPCGPNPPPDVPTIVDAGFGNPTDGPGSPLLWGLAGVAAVTGASAMGGRRLLRR